MMAITKPSCSVAVVMALRVILNVVVAANIAYAEHGTGTPNVKLSRESRPYVLPPLAATTAMSASISGSRKGFQAELIHREHYSSPLRIKKKTASITTHERVREAVSLSHARARTIAATMAVEISSGHHASKAELTSPLASNQGSYLMLVQLATPPQTIQVIADTGSDLVWVRCKPFNGTGGPILNLKTSPSYQPIPCLSSQCQALVGNSTHSCNTTSAPCGFRYAYGDGSALAGDLASDTLTMTTTDGDPQPFFNFSFGCAHQASGDIGSVGGIVGLGQGSASLPSQLGNNGVDPKFSYCLVSFFDAPSRTSSLIFGDAAFVQGPGVQSTPLVPNKLVNTYYYLDLQAITMGGTTVSMPAQLAKNVAGTIIDSGTTLTYISSGAFAQIFQALRQATSDLPQVNGSETGLEYCVDVSGHSNYSFPQLVLHFQDADMIIPAANYLLAVFNARPSVLCFVMVSNEDFSIDLSIVGNLFQQNTQILYDIDNLLLSFSPAQC